MKLRLSFNLKVILPFLVLGGFFLGILISVPLKGNPLLTVLAAAGLFLSLLLGVGYQNWLRGVLARVRKVLSSLNRGEIPDSYVLPKEDELGGLGKDLGIYVEYLGSLRNFVRALSSGDLGGRILKRGPADELGTALLSLRERLEISMKESEERRLEEEHQRWKAEGLARFAKLFREAEDDLRELSSLLMRDLIAFTEADVGALFISGETEEGSPVLQLTGSYAYDREKQIERSFRIGEGLVGRAAREKSPVSISDLPPDYMKIRSGLGEHLPSHLLLVPVMLDDRVLGVLELASLGEIPEYQVEFIRQLGDALAATISKIKVNLQNRNKTE